MKNKITVVFRDGIVDGAYATNPDSGTELEIIYFDREIDDHKSFEKVMLKLWESSKPISYYNIPLQALWQEE